MDANEATRSHSGPPPGAAPSRLRSALLILAGLAAAAALLVAFLPRGVTGSDVGDIRAAVADAILALNRDEILPPDVRPGHFTAADRARLRAASRSNLAAHFAGQALTNILTNHLEWIDRMAVDPHESWGIFFELRCVDMEEPPRPGSRVEPRRQPCARGHEVHPVRAALRSAAPALSGSLSPEPRASPPEGPGRRVPSATRSRAARRGAGDGSPRSGPRSREPPRSRRSCGPRRGGGRRRARGA